MGERRGERAVVGRVVGEFLVIVVGVLVALQVEGWAEDNREQERATAHLEALRADFQDNLRRLDRDIADQERNLEATRTVFALADGQIEMVSADSLRDVLARAANSFVRFEPVSGAYDALVASGDLSLFADPELRVAMARWIRQATDGYEDAPLGDLYRAELGRRGGAVLPMWRTAPAWALGMIGYEDVPARVSAEPLLRDSEYMSLLLYVGAVEGLHMDYFRRLRRGAERVLGLIDASLEAAS